MVAGAGQDRTTLALSLNCNPDRRVRHLLDGDVTIFRDDPTLPKRGWEAWEFSDAASGEAALFSFRQESSDEHRSFDGQHHWDVDLPKRGATLLREPKAARS